VGNRIGGTERTVRSVRKFNRDADIGVLAVKGKSLMV
jgi:hypothetical protein